MIDEHRKLRLLIVEDSKHYVNVLRLCVNNIEAEVRDTPKLTEALEIIDDWIPDVVALDLGLQDSESLQTISSIPRFMAKSAIVVLTGSGEYANLVVASGADAFLQKDGYLVCKSFLEALTRASDRAEDRLGRKLPIVRLTFDADNETINTLHLYKETGQLSGKVCEQAKHDPLGAEVLSKVMSLEKSFVDFKLDKEKRDKVLERIETAVIGDAEAGTTGLVKRIANIEEKQGAVDRKMIFFSGIWATIMGIFAIVAAYWQGRH